MTDSQICDCWIEKMSIEPFLQCRECVASNSQSLSESIGENDYKERQLFDFDIRTYRDGTCQLTTASETDKIHYSGRFLHFGPNATRIVKANTTQFDWPGTGFSLHCTNTRTIAVRLKGRGNYFNVFLNDLFHGVISTSKRPKVFELCSTLNPENKYHVHISKRTEPQAKSTLSTFKVCTLYGYILDQNARILPCDVTYKRKFEFIGDSDTTAFGNECKVSDFRPKAISQNVHNGYACILARMFDAEAHITAWSGKGVHSNSADWGDTMPTLWKKTIASRSIHYDLESWIPDAVVINLGVNDLYPPISSNSDVATAYVKFLREIRRYRPLAHIFCIVTTQTNKVETARVHREDISLQLKDIVKVALMEIMRLDPRIHYTRVQVCLRPLSWVRVTWEHAQVPGKAGPKDHMSRTHYSVSDHVQIATSIADEIASMTNWAIECPATCTPYPITEESLLRPKHSHSNSACRLQ
uniref:Carbohydrate esterase putative n=1 Tax=Albugo laibachii Nc14 TaxID=890382 RepID=F0VZI8_9STRA|nr:carbohydrate esterase putative [Albugo laibachii Nc14]|eukprot:CCA14218.1 carbohydrate esterase putative [Albugo laibachii Nc14]